MALGGIQILERIVLVVRARFLERVVSTPSVEDLENVWLDSIELETSSPLGRDSSNKVSRSANGSLA